MVSYTEKMGSYTVTYQAESVDQLIELVEAGRAMEERRKKQKEDVATAAYRPPFVSGGMTIKTAPGTTVVSAPVVPLNVPIPIPHFEPKCG